MAEVSLEAIQGAQRALRALARERSAEALVALQDLGPEDRAVAGVMLGRCAIFLAGSHPGVARIDDMADGMETMIGRRLRDEVERGLEPDADE